MLKIATIAFKCEIQERYLVKGIDIIEGAASELKEHQFYIFGNTQKIIPENDNVVFCGFLEHHQVLKKLKDFDFYFQPSRSESFGMAVLEAMSLGLTPIVSNRGALPEIVGNTGIIFDFSVSEAIKVLKEPLKIDEDKLKSRSKLFSYENRKREIHKIIEELVFA
ncbi:glycosyltransferase family 4 protein [uncultured Methanolobus sp.]|uniref:glycosyltransferase family 4 protein n=1 Tax=uncultured Methanolobus sp. TaxID=218300 RepID=UPI002AAA67ED|nr:glycosyltransferase family 4 protein [uncultured Methanolobus sp.]